MRSRVGTLVGTAGVLASTALATVPVLAQESIEQPATERRIDFPVRVAGVEVRGLDKTAPSVVELEVGWEPGRVVTREDWDLALTRLWNTNIFDSVDATLEDRPEGKVAVFRVTEKFTINPLFRFASDGDITWLQVGASDVNLLGRYQELAVLYERFGSFNGGQVWWRDPRAFGTRVDLLVQLDRLVRPRPAFVQARSQGRVEVNELAWSDQLRYGARLDVFADRFLEPGEGEPQLPDELEGAYLEPGVRVGRVDTVRLRMKGASIELRPGAGVTSLEDQNRYARVNLEGLAFAMAGHRWNFAARVTAGATSWVPPQMRYFLGGLDLIRGYPDNHIRTSRYAVANVEVRFTAFDSKYIAFMPVVFSDAAVAERESESGAVGALSAGFGLRALIPYFVDTGLRADLGFPLTDDEKPRPTVGVFQFF